MSIFISYSSKNREIVSSLAEDIGSLGHIVWFDDKLVGAYDWWNTILDQIRNCHLFVFALTEASLKSRPCTLELTYAFDLNKRILPILLNDIQSPDSLPEALSKIHFVDYRKRTAESALRLSSALYNLPLPMPMPTPLPPPPPNPNDGIVDNEYLLFCECPYGDYGAVVSFETETILEIWDWQEGSGRLLFELLGHTATIRCVVYSPDGHYLLTGSDDCTARLWDISQRRAIQQIDNYGKPVITNGASF